MIQSATDAGDCSATCLWFSFLREIFGCLKAIEWGKWFGWNAECASPLIRSLPLRYYFNLAWSILGWIDCGYNDTVSKCAYHLRCLCVLATWALILLVLGRPARGRHSHHACVSVGSVNGHGRQRAVGRSRGVVNLILIWRSFSFDSAYRQN